MEFNRQKLGRVCEKQHDALNFTDTRYLKEQKKGKLKTNFTV